MRNGKIEAIGKVIMFGGALLLVIIMLIINSTKIVVQVKEKYETCSYTKASGKTTEVAGDCQNIKNGVDKSSNFYISFSDGVKNIECPVPQGVYKEIPRHAKIETLGLDCTAIKWGKKIKP